VVVEVVAVKCQAPTTATTTKPKANENRVVYATRQEEMDAAGIAYFSADEVAKHASADDIWIIVDEKVYDVTPYVGKHLGGEEAITRYAGKDNTVPFHGEQHPLKVREVLDEFYIGRLAK